MARIKIWARVPDQSTLKVQVVGGTGSVEGFLAESNGNGRKLSDNQLRAGVPVPLRRPLRASVGLLFTFGAQSTFTVKGSVTKPDGSVHGTPYNEAVTGNAGQVVAVNIVAITLK